MQRRLRPSLLANSLGSALATQVLALSLLGANAPTERLQLQWSAPSGCPTLDDVRKDVDGLLGKSMPKGSQSVVAVGTIQTRPDAGYSLSLTANGQTRVIDGKSCEQLAQAAALLLALLVDPARASALSDVLTNPASTPETEPNPTVAANHEQASVNAARPVPSRKDGNPSETPVTSPTTSKLRALADMGIRVDFGSWPKAEPALLLGFGFESESFRVLGHASVGEPVRLRSRAGGGLDLFVTSFDVVPAYRVTLGDWVLEPGVGVELGFTHATSQALAPLAHDAFALSLLGTARVNHVWSRAFRGWVELGTGFPVVRPHWVIQDGEELHRLGAFARLQTGLLVVF